MNPSISFTAKCFILVLALVSTNLNANTKKKCDRFEQTIFVQQGKKIRLHPTILKNLKFKLSIANASLKGSREPSIEVISNLEKALIERINDIIKRINRALDNKVDRLTLSEANARLTTTPSYDSHTKLPYIIDEAFTGQISLKDRELSHETVAKKLKRIYVRDTKFAILSDLNQIENQSWSEDTARARFEYDKREFIRALCWLDAIYTQGSPQSFNRVKYHPSWDMFYIPQHKKRGFSLHHHLVQKAPKRTFIAAEDKQPGALTLESAITTVKVHEKEGPTEKRYYDGGHIPVKRVQEIQAFYRRIPAKIANHPRFLKEIRNHMDRVRKVPFRKLAGYPYTDPIISGLLLGNQSGPVRLLMDELIEFTPSKDKRLPRLGMTSNGLSGDFDYHLIKAHSGNKEARRTWNNLNTSVLNYLEKRGEKAPTCEQLCALAKRISKHEFDPTHLGTIYDRHHDSLGGVGNRYRGIYGINALAINEASKFCKGRLASKNYLREIAGNHLKDRELIRKDKDFNRMVGSHYGAIFEQFYFNRQGQKGALTPLSNIYNYHQFYAYLLAKQKISKKEKEKFATIEFDVRINGSGKNMFYSFEQRVPDKTGGIGNLGREMTRAVAGLKLYPKDVENRARQLLKSVENFLRYFTRYFVALSNSTYHLGPSQVAMYFFYENLSFAASALAILNQKGPSILLKQTRRLRSRLANIINGLKRKDSSYANWHPRLRKSHTHVNALALLTHLSLVDGCYTEKKEFVRIRSTGLLGSDIFLFPKVEHRSPQKASPGKPKDGHSRNMYELFDKIDVQLQRTGKRFPSLFFLSYDMTP